MGNKKISEKLNLKISSKKFMVKINLKMKNKKINE